MNEALRRTPAMAAPAVRKTRPILIVGGAGFIGSNLADRLAEEGHDVLVFDALSRPGVEQNLLWLTSRHPSRVSARIADLRDEAAVSEAVADADGVFHFAAQVAVTTSFDQPAEDFEINARGTLNLLEALRRGATPRPLIFASTNKVYGELADIALEKRDNAYRPRDPEIARHGISEDRALDFHTPYGCSKGAADQYVLDYARSFGLPTAVLRMSCIYGPRQLGTEDQGWVAHFLLSALDRRPITIYGDGCQVRDILYVHDAVAAYIAAYRRIGEISGRAFNLGGGPDNAVSLIEVIARVEELVGRPVKPSFAELRPGDQRYYASDTRRIAEALDLPRPLPWRTGIAWLADWLAERRDGAIAAGSYAAVEPAEAAR
jgi:CDP-paratose 2-epimerase